MGPKKLIDFQTEIHLYNSERVSILRERFLENPKLVSSFPKRFRVQNLLNPSFTFRRESMFPFQHMMPKQ